MTGPQVVVNEVEKDGNRMNVNTLLHNISKSKRRRGRRKSKLNSCISISKQDQVTEAYCCQGKLNLNSDTATNNFNIVKAENNSFIVDTVKEILPSNIPKMEGDDVDRNDVLARRQEKRHAKLMEKLKNKNKKEISQSRRDNIQQEQMKEQLCKENEVDNVLNSKQISREENSIEGKLKKEDSNNVLGISVESEKQVVSQESSSVKKVDKTREEIKAEREVRKQAKLNAKVKSKSKLADDIAQLPDEDKTLKRDEQPKSTIKPEEKLSEIKTVVEHPGKSKSELRAERRAKQEAQRAAKEVDKRTKMEQKGTLLQKNERKDVVVPDKKPQKEKVISPGKVGHQRVKLFSHLKFEQKSAETKIIQKAE